MSTPREPDEHLTTGIPPVPNRDLGTDGTEEVDPPPNTDDAPEPPG
jgi:hypothetical protein